MTNRIKQDIRDALDAAGLKGEDGAAQAIEFVGALMGSSALGALPQCAREALFDALSDIRHEEHLLALRRQSSPIGNEGERAKIAETAFYASLALGAMARAERGELEVSHERMAQMASEAGLFLSEIGRKLEMEFNARPWHDAIVRNRSRASLLADASDRMSEAKDLLRLPPGGIFKDGRSSAGGFVIDHDESEYRLFKAWERAWLCYSAATDAA